MQAVSPTEGTAPELFLFDGRGRHGARLVAAPAGFEHHDPRVWEWVAARVIAEIEAVPAVGMADQPPYLGLTAFSTGDEDASQWGIGYNYPLSKRTAIYTAYARINNDNNQSGKNAGFTVGNSTETGTGNKSFNLGVVHNF